MDNWFSLAEWASVPLVIGVGTWVGRISGRVSENEKDVSAFKVDLKEHMAEDHEAYQKIAKIETHLDVMAKSILRIEDRLNK